MIERFLVTYGAAVLAQALAFLGLIASVRLLGNEANGQLVFCFTLVATTLVIVLQGSRSSIVYFVSRSEIEPKTAFSNAALFSICIGGAGAIALATLTALFPDGPWRVVPDGLLFWICCAVPFAALRELALAMARGLGDFTLFNVSHLAIESMKLAVLLLFAGALDWPLAPTAIGIFAAEILWSTFVILRIRSAHAALWSPSLKAFRTLQSYGSRAAIVTMTSALHRNVDKFMVVGLLAAGSSRLTEYHIALAWLLPATMLSGLLSPVFLPRLADETDEIAGRLTAHLVRVLLWMGAASLMLGCLLGLWLIPIVFGEENRASIQPMLILAPGILGLILTSCVTTFLASRSDFPVWIGVGISGFLANVLLNLLLIPRMGIEGAALSTALTYVGESTALLLYFKRRAGISIRTLLWLQKSDLAPLKSTFRNRTPQSIVDL